jgi:glycosyltransferase involved in cell wall biosynthesis
VSLRHRSTPGEPVGAATGRTLLMVTPYFPPEGGGLEVYAVNLGRRLAREHGWRVVVATSGPQRVGARTEWTEGVKVVRLPSQARLSNTRIGLTWRWDLRRIIRDERPDLVNAHAPVPGLADIVAGLCGGIPLVVTYHAGSMRKGRWAIDWVVRLYERTLLPRLLRRAEWIITSSEHLRDRHLASVRAKCSTITPGVDTSLFTPRTPPATGQILFVGGVGPADAHKGLDTLLEAFGRLAGIHPRARLRIAGGGDSRARHQQARDAGIADRVEFLGRLSQSELREAYAEADMVCLPTRNDSSPLVLLEAMASSRPVVSTPVGGIPHMVSDGVEGYLVGSGGSTALAARLSALLDDPVLAQRMGGQGRKRVLESFSWEGQVTRTDNLFAAIVAGKPGDGRRRLAIVAPHFHPKIGGLEHYAYRLAKGLQEQGAFEVVVFTSNHHGRRLVTEVIDGITVHRFPTWLRVSNTPVSPTWPLLLRRALRNNRVEILNVHTPVPYMAEAAALVAGRRPLVVTYHAGSMVKNRPAVDWVVRGYERRVLPLLLRRAEAVVAVSPMVRDGVIASAGVDARILTPGVDEHVFCPMPQETDQSPATVLFVGRVERSSAWKGVDRLIRAFVHVVDKMPDARLRIVGDGNALDDHRRLAAELGVRPSVDFSGALTGPALVEAYQQAAVVALPSLTQAESFGMSLIEAMACGKPVVGSRIGGIPDVIDDGRDGFLVNPGDVDDLAARCIELLGDPAAAAAMGRRGRQKVLERFTWQDRVDAYEEMLLSLSDPL